MVELKEIKISKLALEGAGGEDFGRVLELESAEDRKEFTGSLREYIGHALSPQGKVFAVACGDEFVGCQKISARSRSIWMPFIDAKHQGKGFEEAALRLGIDGLLRSRQNSEREEIFAAIDREDARALDLFRSFGFRDSADSDGDWCLGLPPDALASGGDAQEGRLAQVAVSLKEFSAKAALEGPEGESLDRCFDLVAEDVWTHVAPNWMSIADAIARPETARPFAIFNDGEMVGFIMFCIDGRDYVEFKNPRSKAAALWRLMIDLKHQGKGYGKAALKLGLGWVKKTVDPDEIWTSSDNKMALGLYESLGFAFTGLREDDAEVMLLKIR